MTRRFWLIPIVREATLLYRNRSALKQIQADVHVFDLSSAGIYDALNATFPGGTLSI